MKKGAMLRKNYELILFGVIFLSVLSFLIYFVSAFQVNSVDGSKTFVLKEDQSFTFNITMNSTIAGANITIVNITIDSTFAFKAGTNGTSASANIQGGNVNITFTNTSTVLQWVNTSALILPDTNATFWFNITPSTPGTYTITVIAANGSGVLNTTSLTVIVSEIHNVMTTAGTRNFSVMNEDTSTIFNVSLNSTVPVALGNITNITITFPSELVFTSGSNNTWLYATTTPTFTNTSTSITWKNTTNGLLTDANNGSVWFNLTAGEPGTYNFTVTTVNSQDNGTHIQNFTVSVRDITNPVVTYNCSKTTGISEGETSPTCSCTAVDNYDASPTLVYTSALTTTNAGTYTVTCTATDDATYNSSVSLSYTVDASGGNVVSGGSGGTPYAMTYAEDTEEFSEISLITKQLNAKERIRILVNAIKHNIGVTSLTSSTATIEVSSTPQTATLKVGDTRKFDVTNDGYYDLSVTLNKIINSKADITLKSIYEEITKKTEAESQRQETSAQRAEEKETVTTGTLPETKNNTVIIVIVVILVVLIIAGILYYKKRK